MNHIIGLDQSLTATGWARYEDGKVTFGTIPDLKGKAKDEESDFSRLLRVRDECVRLISPAECSLVVIEGLALSRNSGSSHERGALHYMLREAFLNTAVPCVVCGPTTLKKFVTGSGSGKKEQMILEVYKRWGFTAGDNNAADAIGLAMIGACIKGYMRPTTAQQREVLDLLVNPKPKKAKKGEMTSRFSRGR